MICFLEKGTPNIHISVFLKRIPSQYMNDQRHINLRENTILSIVRKKISISFDVKCVIPQINVWILKKFSERWTPLQWFITIKETHLRVNNALQIRCVSQIKSLST